MAKAAYIGIPTAFPVYKEEGKFGDLIVTYSVEIPTNLTEKQKELFQELQKLNDLMLLPLQLSENLL